MSSQQHSSPLSEVLDTHTFKVVEEFSRSVCEALSQNGRKQFQEVEVVFGFTSCMSTLLSGIRSKQQHSTAVEREEDHE
jgi:hypothetical protein